MPASSPVHSSADSLPERRSSQYFQASDPEPSACPL